MIFSILLFGFFGLFNAKQPITTAPVGMWRNTTNEQAFIQFDLLNISGVTPSKPVRMYVNATPISAIESVIYQSYTSYPYVYNNSCWTETVLPVLIDWGDGSVEYQRPNPILDRIPNVGENLYTKNTFVHYYTNNIINASIKIYGLFKRLGGLDPNQNPLYEPTSPSGSWYYKDSMFKAIGSPDIIYMWHSMNFRMSCVTNVVCHNQRCLTEIGECAFASEPRLVNVDFGDAPISKLGTYCFYYTGDTNLTVKSNYGDKLGLCERAFTWSEICSLDQMSIQDCTNYPNYCFYQATKLKDITGLCFDRNGVLKKGLVIGDTCFYYTAIESIDGVFPTEKNDIEFPSALFYGCTKLKSIRGYPYTEYNKSPSVRQSMFYNCSSVKSLDGIRDDVGTIESSAFRGTGISTLNELPVGISNIMNYAFANCASLTNISIIESMTNLTVMNSYIFSGCTGLRDFVIPKSIKSMSSYVGGNSSSSSGFRNVTNIVCHPITPPTITSSTFTGLPTATPIFVPSNSVNAYKSATYWKNRSSYIKPSTTE